MKGLEMHEAIAEVLTDPQAVRVMHIAIEDELIDMRERGISVMGPANGFTVRYYDSTPGPMRMSTRDGLRIGLEALSAWYEAGMPDPFTWRHVRS